MNETTLQYGPRPFVIEHRRRAETPTTFVPDASLVVTAALRTEGLLALLSDAEARTLLAVLSFLTIDGRVHPTAGEVALALGVSERRARERLEQLAASAWRGQPVLVRIPRESGPPAWTPGPALVSHKEIESGAANRSTPEPAPAGREAVVASSRELYGTPRVEAERMVEELLGHSPEESQDTPEGETLRRLLALGVPAQEASELLATEPLEEIVRQLDWLPYRHAKSPARLIVAAIEGHYEPPARVRLEQVIASEEAEAGEERSEREIATTDTDAVSLPIPETPLEGHHG